MPVKTHKSEYTILLVLAALTGLVLFWLAGHGMIRADESERRRLRTTQSASDEGLLACYTLFERLGIEVSRSNRMLLPEALADKAVVFLIDPVLPVHTGERESLSQWIARGGVLVTTESMKDLDPVTDRLSVNGYADRRLEPADVPSAEIPEPVQVLPLARDVATVCFQGDGTFGRWAEPNMTAATSPALLFADGEGVRIVGHRMGQGHIIVLSESSFLANGLIARDDNSVLAANVAAYALALSGGRKILFDEYHFGTGGPHQGMATLGGMLFTTSAGWCVLTLTGAGILYLILKGRQFGPRHDLRLQQRRRSKLEYVFAVGSTYRAAGAHGLTFQLIYSWFRQKIAGRTGLPPTATNHALAQELARRSRSDPGPYERTLAACDGMVSQMKMSQHQLDALVERLAQMEREALHGFGDGKRDRR